MGWLASLFGAPPADSPGGLFNQATEHFRQVRFLVNQPEQLRSELALVSGLCVRAIDKQAVHGDAYVLLANALSIAASYATSPHSRKQLQDRSAAVIWHWAHSPFSNRLGTKNGEIGRQLLQMSRDELCRDRHLKPDEADQLMAELAKWLAPQTLELAAEPVIRAEILGSPTPVS